MGAIWRQSRGRWGAYAMGHYRRDAPYKNRAWLIERYVTQRRTITEIAAESGVHFSAIIKAMDRHGIARRNRSDARVGRRVGAANSAWRGGVAEWDYAAGWKVIARRIRGRDDWTCQLCGTRRKRWGKLLHVHHIDGDKLNNAPGNLISLCFGCHPRGEAAVRLAAQLGELARHRPLVD